MGSGTRYSRNSRFIKAFNDLFIGKFGSDDKAVKACGLATDDSDEAVHVCYEVKFKGKKKQVLMLKIMLQLGCLRLKDLMVGISNLMQKALSIL